MTAQKGSGNSAEEKMHVVRSSYPSFLLLLNRLQGCLIGRLLRYMMLHRQGIDPRAATFDTTKAGKPYLVRLAHCHL